MQDRYTGDIGDFSKLGLLRALRARGLTIGLNWYLTPDETHNEDGRHVDYLFQERFRACDEGLWSGLRKIVEDGERKVRSMERDEILEATFFSERLDFGGMSRSARLACRTSWFGRSLEVLAGNDVICADPDNGLVVPSAAGGPRENKYILPSEVAAYYARGSSVIYYQHKARRKDPVYVEQLGRLLREPAFAGATGLALKFKTTSQRYYMFAIQPRHREIVERAVDEMLSTGWGEHFCVVGPPA